jgi:small-conductance mechanosensitive channel
LRALSGEMVVLTNANLLNQQINNLADFRQRRVVLTLDVLYQTEPGLLERLPDELRAIVEAQPLCRFDRAHIVQFAPSAIQLEMVFIVEDPGLLPMMDARHQVAIAIVRRFHELGVEFAFPAQVSYLAGPDGRIVEPHPDDGPSARPAHLGGRRPARA